MDPVDNVIIMYTDPVDENGQKKMISTVVQVYTETGKLEVPQQAQPDSTVEIKVVDFDANEHSDSVDTVNVVVYSDALSIRKN